MLIYFGSSIYIQNCLGVLILMRLELAVDCGYLKCTFLLPLDLFYFRPGLFFSFFLFLFLFACLIARFPDLFLPCSLVSRFDSGTFKWCMRIYGPGRVLFGRVIYVFIGVFSPDFGATSRTPGPASLNQAESFSLIRLLFVGDAMLAHLNAGFQRAPLHAAVLFTQTAVTAVTAPEIRIWFVHRNSMMKFRCWWTRIMARTVNGCGISWSALPAMWPWAHSIVDVSQSTYENVKGGGRGKRFHPFNYWLDRSDLCRLTWAVVVIIRMQTRPIGQ